MEPFLLLVIVPLLVALGLFVLLRRRNRRPLVAGCAALASGVALTFVLAVIVTLRAIF
jgi:LPXTG-motif cell wall-anchored protein